MDMGLQVTMSIKQQEYISGESVLFDITLTHNFKTPASVVSFTPTNRSLNIVMEGSHAKQLKADQMDCSERDGFFMSEPGPREVISLEPGKKLELQGDLLSWFGQIPPGQYKAYVIYNGILRTAQSDPATVHVLPANTVAASVPKWGLQLRGAPFTAAWAHKQAQGILLFYQQQSPYLPRNPWHCLRAATVNEPMSLQAACLAKPDCHTGHLYWQDGRERLFLAVINLQNGQTSPPIAVKLPFKGHPLASALSLPDGTMLIPFTDHKGMKFVVLHVNQKGETKTYELDTTKVAPIGPYVCFWENDLRLHFAWAKANGRQIEYAMLPLDDLSSGFATRSVHVSNDPVIWLDAYLDEEIPLDTLNALYLSDGDETGEKEEAVDLPEPKIMFWSVSGKQGQLVCTKVNSADAPIILNTSNIPDLSVISSIVTLEYEIALLLADTNGKLYYASTIRKSLKPLADLVNKNISLREFPALMKAGQGALDSWVHLRYVADGKTIEYVRLEPENEPDAVEKEIQASITEP